MSSTEQIKLLRQQHPEWTLDKIAAEVGLSRQAVQQTLIRAGLPTKAVLVLRERPTDPYLPRPLNDPHGPRSNWVDRFGNDYVTHHCAGAAAELAVSADLMRRGLLVYRAMHPHSACDLVVLVDDRRALRVEVKAGRICKDGTVTFTRPSPDAQRRYDVLAVPTIDGKVLYMPPLQEAVSLAA